MQILKNSVLEVSMTGGETETGIALAEKAMSVLHFLLYLGFLKEGRDLLNTVFRRYELEK